jgi:hypothetical protein
MPTKAKTQAEVRLLPGPGRREVPRTGAVESEQRAEIDVPETALAELWRPEMLERLARAYWRWLNRISLGLLRVVYEHEARVVVLLFRPFALLRFHAPEYETQKSRGVVTWRIDRGLLVAREGENGDGYLRIAVERLDDAGETDAPVPPGHVRVRISSAVANFYPWLRGSGWFARVGTWLYSQTQLRIHILVTNGFLRSLARLELPPSRVGALRGEIAAGGDDEAAAAGGDGPGAAAGDGATPAAGGAEVDEEARV